MNSLPASGEYADLSSLTTGGDVSVADLAHCGHCGKNLRVIARKFIIAQNGLNFCSPLCAASAVESPDSKQRSGMRRQSSSWGRGKTRA